MRMLALAVALALALLMAALAPAGSAATSDLHGGVATVRAHGSDYGRILFDGRGAALYAFTRDPVARGRSTCSGACASAWPPLLTAAMPRAGAGVARSLLGTLRRSDGSRQVTYAGRPLYTYVGDRRPYQVLCQDVTEFGGVWLVVRPGGRLVR